VVVTESKKSEETSEAAQKLLARAQKVYDETIADAKAEAEEILKNANARASSGVEALEEERDALKNEIDMLKAAAKDYKARFLALIEDQQHVLKAENVLFE
jgi:cell division septum initiation protein DivIVA